MKKTNSGRETNVLLESMYKSIQTIAEGHGIVINKLDEVESELGTVKMAVMELSSDTKAIDMRLSAVDSRLTAVDTRLKVVEKKLDENLDRHEKRIAKLENKVLA